MRCSSGREEDCTPAARPQPARRCHLRPCAAWHTGSWSKVREGEGGQHRGAGWSSGARGLCLGSAIATGGGLCVAHLCTLISSLWDHSICVVQPAPRPFSPWLHPFLSFLSPSGFHFLFCSTLSPSVPFRGSPWPCRPPPRAGQPWLLPGALKGLAAGGGESAQRSPCHSPHCVLVCTHVVVVCPHAGPSASSAPAAVAGVPPCGTCSVWTHGTSSRCGPSTASRGLPSRLPAGPAGPSPASAGTSLPGGR